MVVFIEIGRTAHNLSSQLNDWDKNNQPPNSIICFFFVMYKFRSIIFVTKYISCPHVYPQVQYHLFTVIIHFDSIHQRNQKILSLLNEIKMKFILFLWMKGRKNCWVLWLASFIEEFHSSNYGVKGYMFCLQSKVNQFFSSLPSFNSLSL